MTAKPPPLPERPRRFVQELPIGGPPVLSAAMNKRIVQLNNAAIREFLATFRRPDGKPWGAPDVTAMQIMFATALERAAKYQKLECIEEARQRAAERVLAGPYPEDEITLKMQR